ncbi:MAG: S-layer homology domain-containing protein [Candidatus Peribacteraceae bacterium]|nr:S-layer homology domain-containing protein [Candidatus Peribacteraceae bacterium]
MKNAMCRFVSVVVAAFLFFPAALASTTQGTIKPSIWSHDTEVTITGNNLEGHYFRLKRLCLAPEAGNEVCFGHYDEKKKQWINDSENIKIWNGNTIMFSVFSNTPSRGSVKLYTTEDVQKCYTTTDCYSTPTEGVTILGQYTTKPYITDVIDLATKQSATTIEVGKRYEIKGTLFGVGGDIYFGEAPVGLLRKKGIFRTDIISWSHNSIIFSPSEPVDSSYGMKINNGASDSNAFTFVSQAQISSAASSSVTSVSVAANSLFSDVASAHPYNSAIGWAKNAGILSGYPDGTFRPDQVVNRAEFLKIVLEAKGVDVAVSGSSGFKDVNENGWYAPYVRYAKAQGTIQGYPDGTFKPDQAVNFAEALKMAYNTLDIATTDVGGNWYDRYLQHAKTNGVLFAPEARVDTGMSRKDVVWIVWKLMNHDGNWQLPQGIPISSNSSIGIDTSKKTEPNIQFLTIYSYWSNWDSDAENDGFKIEPHFKNDNDELIYPNSKDWTVTVNVYDAEVNYDKYRDFDTHRLGLQDTISFSGDDVKYEPVIGYPFARVSINQLPHFSSGSGYSWIEAEFSSPTYGSFSASESKPPSFRHG